MTQVNEFIIAAAEGIFCGRTFRWSWLLRAFFLFLFLNDLQRLNEWETRSADFPKAGLESCLSTWPLMFTSDSAGRIPQL